MAAAQMSLSVLIVGQSVGWSLENSYARALKGLGWTVNFWNPQEVLGAVSRGARLGRLFSTFVNVEPWLRKANLELLKTVDRLKPNLVLVIATEGIRAGTLGQLRAQHPDTLLYCLFPDTPHNLVPDRILSLPFFDRVMTVSPTWMDAFARAGAKRVNYLPLAADPELHHPPNTSPSNSISAHDVAFIGIWRPEREAFLNQLTDFDLCVWGSSYWKRNASPGSRVPSHWGGRALFGAEFSQACANSRILLNMIDGVGWPGPNMRTFEQPACRAFSMVGLAPYFQNVAFRLLLLVPALVAGFVCLRWLEGLPWRALGLALHRRWWWDFLVGSVVGVASLAVAAGIATAGGGLSFVISGRAMLVPVAQTLASSALLFVLAALAEEALFRGYPLQTLTRSNLAWLAVFLTSVPFAAIHLQNPNVAAGFTFANTALAGVWLAVAYLRTRSLWFPLGVHWAWNWALGSLFGLPVSGITNLAPHPLMRGTDLGPAWLTGGSYGIEGGLACTITLIISTIFIWRTGLVSATPEMKQMTSGENPRPQNPPA